MYHAYLKRPYMYVLAVSRYLQHTTLLLDSVKPVKNWIWFQSSVWWVFSIQKGQTWRDGNKVLLVYIYIPAKENKHTLECKEFKGNKTAQKLHKWSSRAEQQQKRKSNACLSVSCIHIFNTDASFYTYILIKRAYQKTEQKTWPWNFRHLTYITETWQSTSQ